MNRRFSEMRTITKKAIERYVEQHIGTFHENRLQKLQELKFADILTRKNPYLFKAKNILTAYEFVKTLLDAYLSAQEEGIFGLFLEGLAVFICGNVYRGRKTKTIGIDLEFQKDNVYYIVSIKSGPHWGNSDQINRMKQNFAHASELIKTQHPNVEIVCVNGCCYGRDNKPQKNGYLKLCGQRFWEFISGQNDLYTDIIEPVGYQAKERNDAFNKAYAQAINIFTLQFTQDYCLNGAIDWNKIVALNSGKESPLKNKASSSMKKRAAKKSSPEIATNSDAPENA